MGPNIPDPIETARKEASRINADREAALVAPVERVLADAPFLDRGALLSGLDAFHQERMRRVPSAAKYPESAPWVEFVLAVDREVQALAGLSDAQMAQFRSLHHYLSGQRLHPEQGLIGYTLISYATLLDERRLIRWQRTALPELKYPDEPEVFEF